VAVPGLVLLLFSCGNPSGAGEAGSAKTARRRSSSGGREAERVRIVDDCDPATFNAQLGPGACVGRGETTFQQFIAELTATRIAEEWKFDDDQLGAAPGAPIVATNRGGETHTFTKVNQFGGGFVPALNALSGNLNPAPECAFPAVGKSFVPAGGSLTVAAPAKGTAKFQCCIHPWMRAVVTVDGD